MDIIPPSANAGVVSFPLYECPTSLIDMGALATVRDFFVHKTLKTDPVKGGYYNWPYKLVESWVHLSRLYEEWEAKQQAVAQQNVQNAAAHRAKLERATR